MTPTARPVAAIWTTMSFWVLSEANEMARMSAAQVTSRPVRASELTIAWRHARASRTQVRIAARGEALFIEIVDDGRTDGHGLRGMAERAAAVGGEVIAGPRSDRGWRVQATLPLNGQRP